ncbi:restriction endonuclease [Paraburkholderia sp. D15]|uniref:restriction endonuclease n=1 Tax=Paraburkholderia sp. D15 TaxID=2880218 RepID=UPI00247B2BB4|nr:restriction endonuclease [Paraburkholderia sp. D15]WGS54426.1 restriction endonuclease [Paraburkholderia sp. D15]
MFDVFTDEIELLIKDGLANLYWYKGDLHKTWLSSKVEVRLVTEIKNLRSPEGSPLTKRDQMDALYERIRTIDYNRRLEISRNFVRVLIERESFVPQDRGHQIQKAQLAALRLRELLGKQSKEQEVKQARVIPRVQSYDEKRQKLHERFLDSHNLTPQQKGYALEKLFADLMEASGIPVERPFNNLGEQIDGAIKYEGRYYLIELKWTADKADPVQLRNFYVKLLGKPDGRGIFLSMSGFTSGAVQTLPHGKEINMVLLDGVHLSNVLFGHYTFKQLLDHAVKTVSLKGEIYCSHALEKS